ncbi:MAG: protein kinase domain-containing protein [Bryobacteraceae bacterium]
MPSLREEITKAFLRISRRGSSHHPSSGATRDTVFHPVSREGRQFGSYRILKRLGAGGMGEVYLAFDVRLERQVALKFLPPDLTSNEAAVRRFQKEARTASALNHPNILTIHEVGQVDGEHFIASEYIDGITLRTAVHRGALELGTALDFSIQIASALMAAHSAGVVHRDLKPTNVMIRPDGYLKVIDFGLAKLVQTSSHNASLDERWTRPGTVIGTTDYMSPEQARGDAIDHRTDLWSLGIILYEMVARKRPFEGDTESHIVVGILDKPVPPFENARALPSRLIEISNRALVKDRAKRYQTAGEILSDLQELAQTVPRVSSGIRPIPLSARPDFRKRLIRSGGISAALIIAWIVWWWGLNGKETVLGPDWFRIESVRQLTFNGRTKLSCISPDGKYLAFVVGDPGGLETLYLKQVDQASEQVKIPARKIDYEGITFSPDSQTIFVVEKDEKLMGRLYRVPIIGVRPITPILTDIDGPVSFSPSGDQFAFVRYLQEQHAGVDHTKSLLEVAARNGSERKTLISLEDFTLLWRVAWAPKRNRIAAFAFSNSGNANGTGMLDLIDQKGRETRRPVPGWWKIGQPWWTNDSRTLIVSAATPAETQTHAQLREVAVDRGKVQDVTKDLTGYDSASLTRDGQQLTAVKLDSKAVLWVSVQKDFSGGQSASIEAEQKPSLAWSDETHLILNSQTGGFPNLSLFDLDTRTLESLTNDPYVQQDAASVPGSKSVVFSSNRSGEFHIWKFDPESNAYTQLTFGSRYEDAPSVSPDGKWIVYTSWTVNNPHLYKVPVAGGKGAQIGTYFAKDAQVSPDGKFIVCEMQDQNTSQWSVAVIPSDGSGQPRFVPSAQIPVRWSPNAASLTSVLTNSRESVSNVWAIPLDGSVPRQLTHFEDEIILKFAWSPRGDQLACIRASSYGDAVLFKRQKSR